MNHLLCRYLTNCGCSPLTETRKMQGRFPTPSLNLHLRTFWNASFSPFHVYCRNRTTVVSHSSLIWPGMWTWQKEFLCEQHVIRTATAVSVLCLCPHRTSSGTILSVGHPCFHSTQSTTHEQCVYTGVIMLCFSDDHLTHAWCNRFASRLSSCLHSC